MKKLAFILLMLFALTSCSNPNANSLPPSNNTKPVEQKKENPVPAVPVAKTDSRVRAVSIDGNGILNIPDYKDLGFNLIFLSSEGVRIPKAPYRTDYKALKLIENNIKILENSSMDYIIEFKSGPGFSNSGKISTIYANDTEALYFSKMVEEIIKRHILSKNFKGISINLENPDIPETTYYNTMKYIISKIHKDYPDVPVIFNFYPASFENDFAYMPRFDFKNVTYNASISLIGISYPGYGTGYKTSFKLNKNEILSKLQKLKDIQDKNSMNFIVTVKVPWADNSDVFLQDIYEIAKMLHFDINLYSSSGAYNFMKNEPVIKVIKRNSK